MTFQSTGLSTIMVLRTTISPGPGDTATRFSSRSCSGSPDACQVQARYSGTEAFITNLPSRAVKAASAHLGSGLFLSKNIRSSPRACTMPRVRHTGHGNPSSDGARDAICRFRSHGSSFLVTNPQCPLHSVPERFHITLGRDPERCPFELREGIRCNGRRFGNRPGFQNSSHCIA